MVSLFEKLENIVLTTSLFTQCLHVCKSIFCEDFQNSGVHSECLNSNQADKFRDYRGDFYLRI